MYNSHLGSSRGSEYSQITIIRGHKIHICGEVGPKKTETASQSSWRFLKPASYPIQRNRARFLRHFGVGTQVPLADAWKNRNFAVSSLPSFLSLLPICSWTNSPSWDKRNTFLWSSFWAVAIKLQVPSLKQRIYSFLSVVYIMGLKAKFQRHITACTACSISSCWSSWKPDLP